MAKKLQTRKEYYDYCKEKGLPLPELIKAGPGIASEDVNVHDVREFDPEEGEHTATPWRRPDPDA